jgi:hypothetical protein
MNVLIYLPISLPVIRCSIPISESGIEHACTLPFRFCRRLDSLHSPFDEISGRACYNYVALAFLAAVGLTYLTRRGLWDKSDPYYQKWLGRLQEAALSRGPSTEA